MPPEELTTAQVAAVVGCCCSYVRRWAERHGIDRTIRREGPNRTRRAYYPADHVHEVLRPPEPAALRFHRFIRNPLNRLEP